MGDKRWWNNDAKGILMISFVYKNKACAIWMSTPVCGTQKPSGARSSLAPFATGRVASCTDCVLLMHLSCAPGLLLRLHALRVSTRPHPSGPRGAQRHLQEDGCIVGQAPAKEGASDSIGQSDQGTSYWRLLFKAAKIVNNNNRLYVYSILKLSVVRFYENWKISFIQIPL